MNLKWISLGVFSLLSYWIFYMLAKDLARKGHGYLWSTIYTQFIVYGAIFLTLFVTTSAIAVLSLSTESFGALFKGFKYLWVSLDDLGILFLQWVLLLGSVLFSLIGAHFGVQLVIRDELKTRFE